MEIRKGPSIGILPTSTPTSAEPAAPSKKQQEAGLDLPKPAALPKMGLNRAQRLGQVPEKTDGPKKGSMFRLVTRPTPDTASPEAAAPDSAGRRSSIGSINGEIPPTYQEAVADPSPEYTPTASPAHSHASDPMKNPTATMPSIESALPHSVIAQTLNALKPGNIAAAMGHKTPLPAVRPGNVTSVDLLRGVETKHLNHLIEALREDKALDVAVTVDDAKALKGMNTPKEKASWQRILMKTYEALNSASADIKKEIQDYDAKVAERATPKLTPQEEHDFKSMCRNIVQAQQAKVNQMVKNELAMQSARHDQFVSANVKFGVKLAVKGLGLASSITTAATGAGTPLGFVGMALSVYGLADQVKSFVEGRDAGMKAVLESDEALKKMHQGGPDTESHKGKKVAAELMAAAHLSFPKDFKFLGNVRKHEENVRSFMNKSYRAEVALNHYSTELQKHYDQLSQSPEPADEKQAKQRAGMLEHLEKLQTKVSELQASIVRDHDFIKDHLTNCEVYRSGDPKGLKQTGDVVETAPFNYAAFELAKNIKGFAEMAVG